ncbi:hypothetical protein QE400_000473 [Xanthomonas sacchari]|uniref:hypothetical protein n=1 Tax=Xanthomonas sacchari TaxID=56458 RepID=UPI002781D24A|nr:hypothetical protein [Xanthomonas sacchari]MDQ1091060.1 hypothetical protein [Xanthomonas sacchari]
MTAIALLDVENDPHLVADTLLSAAGPDPAAEKTLWLPALGLVTSEWQDSSGTFHLCRLARKTFVLPNNGGIVAFAGDCATAFALWTQLSEVIKRNAGFDSAYRFDASALQSALTTLGERKDDISLLGILVDAQGIRTRFVHSAHTEVTTRHFGTCFVAGSGAAMVEQMIRAADQNPARWRWSSAALTPCEDLAEGLSTEMLYRESSRDNGASPDTPIALGCGGFYEWYKVTADGVRYLQPRLDLHVCADRRGLTFVRIYLAELHGCADSVDLGVPSQRYSLMVMNLILEPLSLDHASASTQGYALRLPESRVTRIESAFMDYDRSPELRRQRMDRPLDAHHLQHLFAQPLDLRRVRLLLHIEGEDEVIADRLVRPAGVPLAKLRVDDGTLVLDLNAEVTKKIARRVQHIWRD